MFLIMIYTEVVYVFVKKALDFHLFNTTYSQFYISLVIDSFMPLPAFE